MPALMVMSAAAPAVPVAVNVAAGSEPETAVNVFVPAVVPSRQLPTVAIPLAFVVVVPPVTDPPPLATLNVTVAPATAAPFASVTFTDGATATFCPAIADCPSPLAIVTLPAPAAVPVAVNVTGDPTRPEDVAVNELEPGVAPNVHDPTCAMPWAFVVAFAPVIDPPPDATANVTLVPLTGFPLASSTFTDGGTATAVPASAL